MRVPLLVASLVLNALMEPKIDWLLGSWQWS